VIAGRYEPLENGLARDTELGRVVRLRWLADTDVVDDPRLSHPNVVRVFDIGEDGGRRFAAVEHVQGLPLALAAPLPTGDAVSLGVQACRALAAAHDLGLAHVGEILVRADGVPKLAGFRPGDPGDDVQTLAEALNDASPDLPPLHARTTTELALELERARPAVTARTTPLPPVRPRRRVPLVPLLAALAVVALAIGLVAVFTANDEPPPKPRVAQVKPVPHAASAEQQARNLAAWLSRYSR
jgi:hypothetical protein